MALWKQAMREVYGGREDTEVAEITGLSQPWVNQIRNGRIPSKKALLVIADSLQVEGDLRRRIFDMAGYADPAGGEAWNPDAAFNDGIRQLREEFGVDFQVSTEEIWLARQSPEQIEQMLAAFRARLEERRKRG